MEGELDDLTDEQVDQRRRNAIREQERRQKVAAGPQELGRAAHDYMLAARLNCEHTPAELGQLIIDHITATQDEAEGD